MKIKNSPTPESAREVPIKLKVGKRRYTVYACSMGGEITHFQYKQDVCAVQRGDTLKALKQLESVLKVQDKKKK